jgi:acyl-homoserine-lactone acylase
MRLLLGLLAAVLVTRASGQASPSDVARWQDEARRVTIIRDDWGIAHVHGPTDADAVFGAEYAQAEDDFNRVETNYINALGRLAEAEGESAIYQDLRMKLFINPDTLRKEYAASPDWLRKLMDAFADGLNFYLYKHPNIHPRVITRFEPWMALAFTEGSIGGDIERVNVGQLKAFYGGGPDTPGALEELQPLNGEPGDDEPRGSNGIAISANNTVDHHALLLINPHTSFFFRSELQVSSDEGLNAYGASTWGQFFIYQGFNDKIGWMHTSSGADFTDEFLETVTKAASGGYTYKHGSQELPVVATQITVPYRTPSGGMDRKTFTAYYTQHGPVTRELNGRWVTFALMHDHVNALIQSYTRTKVRDYAAFRKIMDLHTNSSNNTIFADAAGDIAYFHSDFIPRRDTSFDWTRPVDGSNPATDWKGVLSVDETPHLFNPASGWLYNSNNWPWSAAGPSSPKKEDFPVYVETGRAESPRGVHAVRVLSNRKDFTLEGLRAAAFDSYQPTFAQSIPHLVQAWDALPATDTLKGKTAQQIALLRKWDFRWGANSVETSLAVYYGQAQRGGGRGRGGNTDAPPPEQLVRALAAASDKLTADFGRWQVPWGEINRFQRLNDDIVATFDDNAPSIPVMFSSANYGSLASFGARTYPNTKKWYGTSGNSFVAVVEFGDSVRAKAVTAGGESGDPSSKHFNDQAERYATGNLRDVYFYKSQLKGHTEREYHPGS